MRCAKELLIAQGIDKFTVSEVALASRLSKPALYYYFDSKEALVYDLALEALHLEVNAIAPPVDTAESGTIALISMLRARIDYFLTDVDSFRILYVWVPALGLQMQITQSEPSLRMNDVLGVISRRLAAERETNDRVARYDTQQLPQMAWALSQGILARGIAGRMNAENIEQCRAMREVACRWLLDSLV